MPNIALLIEYDGTRYSGWQVQKNAVSIQGTLEEVLSSLLGERTKITGAGRTDAGVHARGQVANFHTTSDWKPRRLMYALNGTLPSDIAILAAAEVPEGFNSRYSAVMRRYSYRVVSSKTAIDRNFSAFFPFTLSVEAMNSAANLIRGEMNFRSFTKYADEQRSFICNITKAGWKAEPLSAELGEESRPVNSILRFEVEANRFLHGMVRAVVGTLLDVGRGKLTVEAFKDILESRDRKAASMSAPARGLFLDEVGYEFDVWRVAAGQRESSLL